MRRWIGICLGLLVFGAPLPARAQAGPEGPGPDRYGPPPARAALQSMVLPGWGQASNRAWVKSVLFLGAYGGLVGWGVALNQDKQDAVGELHRALGTEEEAARQLEVDRLDNDRNAKFWFAGFVMLLSMADAFVDAHLARFDDRIDADVARESGGGAVIRLGIRQPLDPTFETH